MFTPTVGSFLLLSIAAADSQVEGEHGQWRLGERERSARSENMMADDGEWVEDVKRWYFAGVKASAAQGEAVHSDYGNDLGYEAAHPALQAHHWPDADHLVIKR